MPRFARFVVLSFVIAFVVVACGSRTGLGVDLDEPAPGIDSAADTPDQTIDREAAIDRIVPGDAPSDRPMFEGGPLDVTVDCPDPTTCDPADPGYVYKCGKRIFRCSSLEQCAQTCTGEECGAGCVNPCQDTLGQDTSNGCEFFALEADVTQEAEGVCFAVFVVNQWKTGEPARIQVERNGATLPIEQFTRIPVGTGTNVQYVPYSEAAGLAKDQIAIMFLSRDPAAANDPTPSSPRALASCPAGVVPAVVGDAATHGTGRGRAFHIKTTVPVVAYQMLPYGAGRARVTGATLLFPTNVWDKNYIAANAYTAATRIQSDRAAPTLAIVAQNDATHVTISPTSAIVPGGGIAGSPANVPITYTINRGEYVQFTQVAELTGSPILADAPVAVIGGSTLMDIPVSRDRADSAHQMLPPVRALGNEYLAVRYRSRDTRAEESVPWRLVGAVSGTTLTYEPARPTGAPTTLAARQLAEFNSPGPFVVRSQDAAHPFYFASYMTGGATFGPPPGGIGDPEFVNVVSPSQYLPRYTFFTDPTYPETNLVVTRMRDPQTGTFPEVSLDCAGTLGNWRAVGTSGRYEFTRIDLSTGDFVGQNGCNNGVHTMVGSFPVDAGASEPKIGLTVWGWGNNVTWPPDDDPAVDETNPKQTRWVSYGYPAGANLKRLNSVVVPAN
jgi:hypothetical protein